jgi:hypothetical protein
MMPMKNAAYKNQTGSASVRAKITLTNAAPPKSHGPVFIAHRF